MHRQPETAAPSSIHGVLFDLDGTLVDTAPDMVPILQQMQREHGLDPVDYKTGRSYVSHGSLGLIKLGFGHLNEQQRAVLQKDFLQRYSLQLSEHSKVFDGLDALLLNVESKGGLWGVVTNKPGFLTDPLMRDLMLDMRSSATISGDTLPQRKPDPAPLLHACTVAGMDPSRTLYVGDALRDIEAGKGAGMQTIAAGYGYVVADDDPCSWGADYVVRSVTELCQFLSKAFRL